MKPNPSPSHPRSNPKVERWGNGGHLGFRDVIEAKAVPILDILVSIFILCKIELRVFFYFLFYRPSRPNFLKIEKKIKRDFFFNFIFVFPSDSCQYSTQSSIIIFRFVYSTAVRLIKLPPVTAPDEILPF